MLIGEFLKVICILWVCSCVSSEMFCVLVNAFAKTFDELFGIYHPPDKSCTDTRTEPIIEEITTTTTAEPIKLPIFLVNTVKIRCSNEISIATLNTCIFNDTLEIPKLDREVITIVTFKAVRFAPNENILYLPVWKNGSGIIMYEAEACNIRMVTHKNFKGFIDLMMVNLADNNLLYLSADTFLGTPKLETILLGMFSFLN